ncbi:MAG: hypothetical protein GXO83_02585 [Chlorobi bacterium]|nr:hypothetical protein [Chlorobiota bacterium]
MKKIIILLTTFLLFTVVYCQEEDVYVDDFSDLAIRKNSIYAEGLGNGIYGSLNYERLFFKVPQRVVTFRAGLSVVVNHGNFHLLIPLEMTAIFGKRHCFETGPGLTLAPGSEERYLFFYRAGYRLRAENGIMFRVAPVFMFVPGSYSGPSAAVSLGYSF